MTRSVFSLVILLACLLFVGFALAQGPENIDMYPSGVPASLERSYPLASISVADLSIPPRARKEFEKASELIQKREFQKALERLNRAIAIDPAFALAYNNLGVVYSHLGDSVSDRKALERAIALSDHFALAYENLGRLDITDADFSGAEAALQKASNFDPQNPVTLILLGYSELMQNHFDGAIATSQKAHALNQPHAFAHRIAARALEQEHQYPEAIAELKVCLAEEPAGSRADAARRELEIVQNLQR